MNFSASVSLPTFDHSSFSEGVRKSASADFVQSLYLESWPEAATARANAARAMMSLFTKTSSVIGPAILSPPGIAARVGPSRVYRLRFRATVSRVQAPRFRLNQPGLQACRRPSYPYRSLAVSPACRSFPEGTLKGGRPDELMTL